MLIYLDDLLSLGNIKSDEHMEIMKEVIRRLRHKGMQLNINKCYFVTDSVEYLGFVLMQDGIKPMSHKNQKMIAIKASEKKQL